MSMTKKKKKKKKKKEKKKKRKEKKTRHSALLGSRDVFLVRQGMPCHVQKCFLRI